MKISKEQDDFIIELINDTGIEIWNADCTLRIMFGRNKNLSVCSYGDPLHPIKEFETFRNALKYIE